MKPANEIYFSDFILYISVCQIKWRRSCLLFCCAESQNAPQISLAKHLCRLLTRLDAIKVFRDEGFQIFQVFVRVGEWNQFKKTFSGRLRVKPCQSFKTSDISSDDLIDRGKCPRLLKVLTQKHNNCLSASCPPANACQRNYLCFHFIFHAIVPWAYRTEDVLPCSIFVFFVFSLIDIARRRKDHKKR